jgi:diguanylate cyclase (GGDEF)-like protein
VVARAPKRRFMPVLPIRSSLIILALSLVGFAFARVSLPVIAFFVPTMVTLAIIADFATFGVLVVTVSIERRRSLVVLAFGFAAAAALQITFLWIVPFAPGQTPVLTVGKQAAPAIYTLWHVVFAFFAIGYVMLWRLDDAPLKQMRCAMIVTGLVTAAVVAACLGIAIGAERALPTIVVGTSLTGYRSSGVGFVALGICICALGCVAFFGRPSRINRGLSLSLLAIVLDVSLILWSGERFTTAWYASRFLYTAGSTFVLYSAVRELIAANRRRGAAALVKNTHAERLAALWEKTAQAGTDDAALQSVLAEGAEALRAGQLFYGQVGHVEGNEFVIDLHVLRTGPDGGVPTATVSKTGDRIPLEKVLHGEALAAGETLAFDDLSVHPIAQRYPAVLRAGWRSAIGAPFVAGTTSYVIGFGSHHVVTPGFTRDDKAYMDVLASFFAARFTGLQHLDRIRYDAEHDTLTGLPNRRFFREQNAQRLATPGRYTLAIADLDHFREINDTLGHDTGDAILVAIAAALRTFAREGEYIARVGGDNFAILMTDHATLEEAGARVREWAAVFSRAFVVNDNADIETVRVNASFGVAIAPDDATTFEELLSRADAAIGVAKAGGGGRQAFFSQEIAAAQMQSLALRSELLRAIVGEQFTLDFQPTVALDSLEIHGAEALIRWIHPTRGLISPDEFIPFAEENGLINEIGRWVLRRAIRDAQTLAANGKTRVYLNLSYSQLDDNSFMHELHDQLQAHPGIADLLGVEVTESVAMRDVDRTLRALQSLRDMGLPIALDDFGTGYSSLSYLKRLPIDVIKIDRSFVAGLPDDPRDVAIVETLLSIAQQLQFQTLAEGVETAAQLAWLTERGCTMAQGFHIARPMSLDAYVAWRAAYRPSVESKTT